MTVPITFLSTVPLGDVLSGRPRQLAAALAAAGASDVSYAESVGWLAARSNRRDEVPAGLAHVRLPPLSRLASVAESRIGAARAHRIARELRRAVPGCESGWIVVSDPRFTPVLRHLRAARVCFDLLDHPRVFAGPRGNALDPAWPEELACRSDLVTCVNPRILQALGDQPAGRRGCWIANGVPAQWLAEPEAGQRRSAPGHRPVAGFLGALFEWVDLDLLVETARALPEVRFVLYGPTRWGGPRIARRGPPNVTCLGPRPHAEVPRLLKTFDVGLVPFRQDEISRCSDPIKLYEYLACGLPVATTVEPPADLEPPSVHVGTGCRGFARAVAAALAEPSGSARAARIEFARRNSWERRAERLLAAMERVERRTSGSAVVPIRPRLQTPAGGRPRVLFVVRADLDRFPGGDTVQIRNTARALRRMGVPVTVTSDPQEASGRFDCVHLWHLERLHESLAPWLRFRRQGVPMLLSPIYWPRGPSAGGPGLARGLIEDGKNLFRLLHSENRVERRGTFTALLRGWRRGRRSLLLGVDMLLPNSQAEAAILAVECRQQTPIRVVHNAVDSRLCRRILDNAGGAARRDVVSVGHFDPRKNQLGLIRAMRGRQERLLLIGSPRRIHRRYFERCRREAGPNVRFLGTLPRLEVLRTMRASRLHVCPSHFETPGLANLEAATMGCPLVLPDCPPVREYFGDGSVYFRPGSERSLAAAIGRALEAEPGLEAPLVEQPDWKTAATETLAAYEEVLARRTADDRAGPASEVEAATSGSRS